MTSKSPCRAEDLFEQQQVRRQLVRGSSASRPQRLGHGRDEVGLRHRVAAGEQRDLVALADQLLGQPGDDALGAAVELGGNAFVEGRDLCDSQGSQLLDTRVGGSFILICKDHTPVAGTFGGEQRERAGEVELEVGDLRYAIWRTLGDFLKGVASGGSGGGAGEYLQRISRVVPVPRLHASTWEAGERRGSSPPFGAIRRLGAIRRDKLGGSPGLNGV